jgi:hypothetical protein
MERGTRLRVAVAAVRSQALDLLTEASHENALGCEESGPEAVARLQRVSNDLGWVFDKLPAGVGAKPGDPLEGLEPPPSRHAAAALILGYLTVPPEAHPVDQAERWVRILRLHGRTGHALRQAGVRERPLATVAERARGSNGRGGPRRQVFTRAAEVARQAGASTTDTVHVLFAVRAVLGSSLDRALYGHGIGWDQLLSQLAGEPAARATVG